MHCRGMRHSMTRNPSLPLIAVMATILLAVALPAAAASSAQFISQSVTASMVPGAVQSVSVTMRNSGTTTWTQAAGYKLGSQNPQDNITWGTGRVLLGGADSIAPGGQKTFTFNITAPSTSGSYNFQWRMLQEGVEWFGDFTPNVVIQVGSPPAAGTRPVSIGLNANREPNLARSANVGWVRMDLNWRDAESQQGVWDFADEDTRVAQALANGQQILAVLHGVPVWAGGGSQGNIPPLTTTQWSEFVRRVAQRYSGQIAAYEIWNEPNDANTGKDGIGWDRYEWEPPLYVDFFQAAAQEIRTWSPGSQVAGLSFTSRLDNTTKRNRASAILAQMQTRIYPKWDGWCCCWQEGQGIDVLSFHNNGKDATSSLNTALELRNGSLYYTGTTAPCLTSHPVWVTEYGWRANAVTEAGQREKICNITKMYTGQLNPGSTGFDQWNITRSFIYLQKDTTTSQAIFYGANNTPALVVPQYLQRLAYPTVQQPANSADYPNCNGSSSLQPEILLRDAVAQWNVRGLRDPREGLPFGFVAHESEQSANGRSVSFSYKGRDGAIVSVSTGPAEAGDGAPFISDSAAEWTRGDTRISISHRSGPEPGTGWARTLAAAIDPDFARACVEDRLLIDDATVQNLGFHAPKAPKGFVALDNRHELTRMSGGCGAALSASPKNFDFLWSFVGASGEIVRAGIYRYGEGFRGEVINPASLHWNDAQGTRYWVATDAKEMTPALENALYAVARSMDPSFAREPRTRDARDR